MRITRRSFIAAALAVVPLSLIGTTSRPVAAEAKTLNRNRCNGDCGFKVEFDMVDLSGWRGVHYWPRVNPQRYQAWFSNSEDGARRVFDAMHGRAR